MPVVVTLVVNHAVQVVADAYIATEDQTLIVSAALGLLANDSDEEGDSFTASVVAGPAHGTVVIHADGSFSYTPSADYNGSDSFTYLANDGSIDSDPATVSITITPVNDAPTAADDSYSVDEDTTLTINAVDGVFGGDLDIDGDLLAAAIDQSPSYGSLVLNEDGSFSYTPDANFNGSDSFTYRVGDGQLDSNAATVTIAVAPIDDAPVFNSINRQFIFRNTSIDFTLHANDIDDRGAVFSYSLVTAPAGATIDPLTGQFLWTPPEDISGRFSVTAQAADADNVALASQITFEINVLSFEGLIVLPFTRRASRFIIPATTPSTRVTSRTQTDGGGSTERITLRSTTSTSLGTRRLSRLQASRSLIVVVPDKAAKPEGSNRDEERTIDSPMPEGVDSPEDGPLDETSLGDKSAIETTFANPEDFNDEAVEQLEFSTGDIISMRFTNSTLPEWSRRAPAEYAKTLRSRAEILRAAELLALARTSPSPQPSVEQRLATLDSSLTEDASLSLDSPNESSQSMATDTADKSQADDTAKTAMRVAAAAYFMPLLVSQIEHKQAHRRPTKLRQLLNRLLK